MKQKVYKDYMNYLIEEEKDKFNKVRKFLLENYMDEQIFNTKNIDNDVMVNVYNRDNIIINRAKKYGYLEIFGITNDEFYNEIGFMIDFLHNIKYATREQSEYMF